MGQPMNCWEYKRCGREPGGELVRRHGVCPAATSSEMDGVNRGINAGRACWFVSGTRCERRRRGTFARSLGDCLECDFYRMVMIEELKSTTHSIERSS